MKAFTTPYKGNLSSSITFDPDLGDYLEKDQQKQLSKSFHLTMGRASGAFTSLLSVNFPKANFKGMCGGNSGRPHVFYTFTYDTVPAIYNRVCALG